MPNKDIFGNYPRHPHHTLDGDPVGRDEMCELTGRSKGAVAKWIERGSLPRADGPWVSGPTWMRKTFLGWAYKEGFLENPDTGEHLEFWDEGRRWAVMVPTDYMLSVRALRDMGRLR